MEKLLDYLVKEGAVISQAPFTFLVLAILLTLVGFWVAKWHYSRVIDQLKQTLETNRERLLLRTEQMESYKERALKYDEKVFSVINSTELQLADRTLDFVANFREMIERHSRNDRLSFAEATEEMRASLSEEERNRLWTKRNEAYSKLSEERENEYSRRFRVDAMLLRDELRSRFPDYKPNGDQRIIDSSYEHPVNFFGLNGIADDLERMAKQAKNKIIKT